MIDEAFRAANIEIAFPQQDVHLKGVGGLPLEPGGPDGGGESSQTRKASVVSFKKKTDGEEGSAGIAFASSEFDVGKQGATSPGEKVAEQTDGRPPVVIRKRAA